MRKTLRKTKKEIAASLVEYGLLIALIAVIALPAVANVGKTVRCNTCVANIAYMPGYTALASFLSYCLGGAAMGPYGFNC